MVATNDFLGNLRKREFLNKIYEINPSIIHLHGLWRLHTKLAHHLLKGIPYIITPHGMLDNWALRQSTIKKNFLGYFGKNMHLIIVLLFKRFVIQN